MAFLEAHARALLILHTILAVGAVAASTHLVVWMRGYPRGDFRRHAGVRRLSFYAALLFGGAFTAGNLMYPIYRVHVRAEYLDNPAAVVRDRADRDQAARRARDHHDQLRVQRGDAPLAAVELAEPPADLPGRAARVARWFDVKEHWLALGLALALAVAAIVRCWDPRRAGAGIAGPVFALAIGAAATAWVGAIVGVTVASWRAVGGPG